MKVAFIIGHNEKEKGFYSPHLKVSEWDFYTSMVNDLECLGHVYRHNPNIKSYTQRCIEISERIGRDYDLIISLHFNAFNTVANGCEAFYWHSNNGGFKYAKKFVDSYCMLTGSRPRGAKEYNWEIVKKEGEEDKGKLPRGAGEVYYTKSTTILIEPFFGDNKEDCERFDKDKFIKSIKNVIELENPEL